MPNKGILINRNSRLSKFSSKFNHTSSNYKKKNETKTLSSLNNLNDCESEEEIEITFNSHEDRIKRSNHCQIQNDFNNFQCLENTNKHFEFVNIKNTSNLNEKDGVERKEKEISSVDVNKNNSKLESKKEGSKDSIVSESKLEAVTYKMKNRGKARKGFSKITSYLNQQAQKKLIKNLKETSISKTNQINCDENKIVSNRKAKKSFNGQKNINDSLSINCEAGQEEKLFNGDISFSPKKKKRPYYKGHTYGLFLSRKKKKRRKENDADTLEDESIQSGHLNHFESDEELEYASSLDDKIFGKMIGKGYCSSSSEISIKGSESKAPKVYFKGRQTRLNNSLLKKADEKVDSKLKNDESHCSVFVNNMTSKAKLKGKIKQSETAVGSSNQVGHEVLNPKSIDLDILEKGNKKILIRVDSSGSVHSFTTEINLTEGICNKIQSKKSSSHHALREDICCCGNKPYMNRKRALGKSFFCQAIDSFDGKLVGCCNQARLLSLFRSSNRVPYQTYCEVHLARLRRHHCCPGCGLFCTQGQFLECFAVKKQVHLFHKNCQNSQNLGPNLQHCPHCAQTSKINVVRLEMNGPVKESCYFLSQTPIFKMPKAKITINRLKELPALMDFPLPTNELEFSLPQTKKVLSLSGLPYGPDRKQLENLLTSLSLSKSLPCVRFSNKNFYAVAKSGEVDKVLNLLAQGFDPNYVFEEHDNETPLHAAASGGHLMIVHILIQAGANINALNQNLYTPMMIAIEEKHHSVMQYLLKAGADHETRSEDGMTALHIAAKCGNLEAVTTLINNRKINLNLQDDGGWTALVWATEHRHVLVVKYLLSKGAESNVQDDEENIGIHWACYSGDVNIAYIYLELGCDINAANIHGDTPLHVAARRDNYDCVVLLLSRGADLTITNKNQETPASCSPKNSQSLMALKINAELRSNSIRKTKTDKVLDRDVSKGKEFYQISIVNGYDSELPPTDYVYITENCETSSINIDRTITSLQSCDCKDECISDSCICATISLRCWYDREGKLSSDFNLSDPPMIFECNRACSCWKTCYNRVVQFGIRVRLQVFRTKGKGWGLRALKDIPKGTFVCEYIGDIITDFEADRREDDSYLFDLDNRDGETYCLDARFYGNVARFINHLCEPNLTPVKVFVDHQDLSFPRIALFANKDIKAYEELGFDYGEKFWVIKYRWFTCDCSSLHCKYSKDVIHQTLDNYYRRMREDHSSKDGSEDGQSA